MKALTLALTTVALTLPLIAKAFDPDKYNRTRALRWALVNDRESNKSLKPTAWRGKPVGGATVYLYKVNANSYNIYLDNNEYIGYRIDRKLGEGLGELRLVYSDHWTDWYNPQGRYYHAKVKLYSAGEELARTNPQALIARLEEIEPSLDYEVRYRNYRNPQTGTIISKPYIKVIKPRKP